MTKKTETLELRLSPELKYALSNVSKSRGAPMSQIVRSLVEREIRHGVNLTSSGKEPLMTKRTATSIIAGSACILGLASLSLLADTSAVSAQATARMTFAEFDLNADGKVTPDEFATLQANWEAEFSALEEEDFAIPAVCEAAFEEPEGVVEDDTFAIYDLDKNGTVTFEEVKVVIEAELTQEFLYLDEDQNGLISPAELSGVPVTTEDLVADGIDPACAEALAAQEAEFEDETLPEQELRIFFAGLDANFDGQVTMTEFIENQ